MGRTERRRRTKRIAKMGSSIVKKGLSQEPELVEAAALIPIIRTLIPTKPRAGTSSRGGVERPTPWRLSSVTPVPTPSRRWRTELAELRSVLPPLNVRRLASGLTLCVVENRRVPDGVTRFVDPFRGP